MSQGGTAAWSDAAMRTLAIDIGGTGTKAAILDDNGHMVTERARVPTPQPATPEAVLAAISALAGQLAAFDRISAGFPGVVTEGVTHNAPNLVDAAWHEFPLARTLTERFGVPARVANDADVQGYAVIAGRGVEMVLTLGTGMGAAVYLDGRLVPNLELGHHPFRRGRSYEEYIGNAELERIGKRRWNKRMTRVIRTVLAIWNPTRLYLGGGNAKHLRVALPENVEIVSNTAGIVGGLALWTLQPVRANR